MSQLPESAALEAAKTRRDNASYACVQALRYLRSENIRDVLCDAVSRGLFSQETYDNLYKTGIPVAGNATIPQILQEYMDSTEGVCQAIRNLGVAIVTGIRKSDS